MLLGYTLLRFLQQNSGELSKRAREEEFAPLTEKEIQKIEDYYNGIFF